MPDDPQQAVWDFLADPNTHGGAAVTRIDTHAAAVFLAGPRALKIKRNVVFPFLDFSSLSKRKAACDAELEVNRAFAPALYRRVLPITREADGRLAVGGKGETVEWAVEMARFDESQTLDCLAAYGRIDGGLADALGRAVAQAHAAARPVAGFGFAEVLADIIEQNDAELRGSPDIFQIAAVERLAQASRDALVRMRPVLIQRERNGLVRRSHGDLHLGNIVLIDRKPMLFDALEFDERLATADLFYDLAFLLMDLIERDLRPAANIVLNRYLAETRRTSDFDALAALPLLMSVRAAIRAKVAGKRRAQKRDEKALQTARDYLGLALRLIAPPSPRLIAVGGLSGTGKSMLARALAPETAPEPGAVVLRSDVERKALFDVAETERLPPDAYTEAVTARVYASLAGKARQVLAAGHSAIVDAVFARPPERAEIEAAAGTHPFLGLFLTADLAVRIERIGGRRADASDATAAIAHAQEQYELGTLTWRQLDASGTPDEALERALAAMRAGP
jgi:aminoglycoside phosphotransferase family enzyme/predicted kinase